MRPSTPEATDSAAGQRPGLFDLRWIIALLFAVQGLALTVAGIGWTDQADLDKAAGVNINLWTGLSMLAVAAVFALWARHGSTRSS